MGLARIIPPIVLAAFPLMGQPSGEPGAPADFSLSSSAQEAGPRPMAEFLQQAKEYAGSHLPRGGDERVAVEPLRAFGTGERRGLMGRAEEVRNWRFTFRILEDPLMKMQGSRHLFIRHSDGTFQDAWITLFPVAPSKVLDPRRVETTLEQAIHRLHSAGHRDGFSEVALIHPAAAHYRDEPTYVFHCPQEKVNVGISAVTGALLWKRFFVEDRAASFSEDKGGMILYND
jgi:hypothetical protein